MKKREYDAIVVGSGPNGLAAAIRMQQKGLAVLLIEGADTVGGGMRTKELTLPGFLHDVCSAIHPLAVSSPFLKTLPLDKFGLEWMEPEVLAAHPFDNGTAAYLYRSIDDTAVELGRDEKAYRDLIQPIVRDWENLAVDFLGPMRIPKHPISMAKFGIKALRSANGLARSDFKTEKAKGLWAGMAAHSIQPLDKLTTSAVALVLLASGHHRSWPIPKMGSQSIANAMSAFFKSLGGEVQTGFYVRHINELPKAKAYLFDITPKQLMEIAGEEFSRLYKWQLSRFKYGMGVFKIDWALKEAIPFSAIKARLAGTVHLGNTLEEVTKSEKEIWEGKHPNHPYVLLAQQSIVDKSRAPEGSHTAWAYCHVPNGSRQDMTAIIEAQVERFAPGFRDIIIGTSTKNAMEMQDYNPNYIGGDINGGAMDITQLFNRPALRWSPYRTSSKGIYICSSSTPPGGGVHGMCGFHAAERVIKDLFR
ncbi:phytoene desaturase family protein [Aquiflexum sp.]|uniref:phytoene desaturase family protein n=1 Tax=Aquiflexum sp. TaxID=1872584 RepID=UPI0035948987